MDALSLWSHLLDIETPWLVRDCQMNPDEQRLDLWVTQASQRGSWLRFGLGQAEGALATEVWQHLPALGFRVWIHLERVAGQPVPEVQWAGEVGMPFTRGLEWQILSLFNEGLSLPAISEVLGVAVADLWRYRHALDALQGLPSASPCGADPGESAARDVPSAEDPVWAGLVHGHLDIDIRAHSLKLLLTRIRDEARNLEDAAARVGKYAELHRYFALHARMLAYELEQLALVAI